jgi:SAM-dependent methyltransferase
MSESGGGGDRSASYRLEDLDASAELPRLRAQVELLAPREFAALRAMGIPADASLADVGCGPGFFAEKLAAEVLTQGTVVGVDIDGAMIEEARRRTAGAPRLAFHHGTAQRIPLPDASVEVAYARFLFQHLSDPGPVLAEMQRIVRPGGLVVVGDTDDGGLLVHPAPSGFEAFLAASRDAQVARGGDRQVGRKLKGMLVARGLRDVRASTQVLSSDEIGSAALIGIAVGFKAGVLKPPFADPAEVRRVLADLTELAAEPGFYGHALGYLAWGRVP